MAETEVQANNVKTPPDKASVFRPGVDTGAAALDRTRTAANGANPEHGEALEMKARAAEMFKRGTISEAQYDKLVAKADAILSQSVLPSDEVRAVNDDD